MRQWRGEEARVAAAGPPGPQALFPGRAPAPRGSRPGPGGLGSPTPRVTRARPRLSPRAPRGRPGRSGRRAMSHRNLGGARAPRATSSREPPPRGLFPFVALPALAGHSPRRPSPARSSPPRRHRRDAALRPGLRALQVDPAPAAAQRHRLRHYRAGRPRLAAVERPHPDVLAVVAMLQ